MRHLLRVVDVLSIAAVAGGLFLVDPWWLLVLAGLVGLVFVDRAERAQ